MAMVGQGKERSRCSVSQKHPYYRILDDEDLERETKFRSDRKEHIQVKKFIGSGEDADIFNDIRLHDFQIDTKSVS